MGQLFYGLASAAIVVDDRVLHHIQIVATTKLRRRESFTLTWVSPDGTGRETLWMQPSIPMRFVYDCAEFDKPDSSLLGKMLEAASSSVGLTIDPHTANERDSAGRRQLAHAA